MKNNFQKYLIIFFLIHWQENAATFRLSDFCMKTLTLQCEHTYNVTCGRDHCSMNEEACKSFLKLNGIVSRISVEQLLDDKTRKYQKLFKKIKECPILPNLCMNGVNCLQKQLYPMRNGKINILLDVECPCSGKHGHKCENKSYCGINNEACEELSLISNEVVPKIQKCGNDNKIIYKKL